MFADDIAFMAKQNQNLQEIFTRFSKSTKAFGQKINL